MTAWRHLRYRTDFCGKLKSHWTPALGCFWYYLWTHLARHCVPLTVAVKCHLPYTLAWCLPHHIREANAALSHAKLCKVFGWFRGLEGSGCFLKCEVAVLAQSLDFAQFGSAFSSICWAWCHPLAGCGCDWRVVSASWSGLTHCPVEYTVHRQRESEQSRVVVMVLYAKASERNTDLKGGNSFYQVSMITVFILTEKIDQCMLVHVINTSVSKLLSVHGKDVCDVKLRLHFFVCLRRDKDCIEIMQSALCLW